MLSLLLRMELKTGPLALLEVRESTVLLVSTQSIAANAIQLDSWNFAEPSILSGPSAAQLF